MVDLQSLVNSWRVYYNTSRQPGEQVNLEGSQTTLHSEGCWSVIWGDLRIEGVLTHSPIATCAVILIRLNTAVVSQWDGHPLCILYGGLVY